MDVGGLSDGMTAAVATAAPAVVRISRRGASASGTVVDTDLVLTSAAVVGGADEVGVGLEDGTHRVGAVLGSDHASDLALVRVDGGGLAALPWRDPRTVKVGELVLALARPGRSIRASARIVGVVGRDVSARRGVRLPFWIETDRGLPEGFLGGPLVDLSARLIGPSTDRLVRGADLSIDADTAARVVADLRTHGHVRRGWIGVAVNPARLPEKVRAEAGQDTAALVVDVEPGGPAERAGVMVGDLLLGVDTVRVTGPADLAAALAERVAREVSLRIARGGALETLAVTTTERT